MGRRRIALLTRKGAGGQTYPFGNQLELGMGSRNRNSDFESPVQGVSQILESTTSSPRYY